MSTERRLNVAIADDEPTIRRTFEMLISAIGHTVACTAGDGEELVRKCSESKIDLAFVDLHMPVMDGLEAAELLAAKSIPVVLVSGHPDSAHLVLEEEPVVALIQKPASLPEILAAIAKATPC
jgi:CheY-like chemotaxis protein